MAGIAYVETSALMRVCIEGDDELRRRLDSFHLVVSDLTLIEAHRVLRQAELQRRPNRLRMKEARRRLRLFERRVDRMPVDEDVVERCRDAFPIEPIRSLDAIHVASAELWTQRVGTITVFSFDPRVRDNVVALGMPVHPPA